MSSQFTKEELELIYDMYGSETWEETEEDKKLLKKIKDLITNTETIPKPP